MWAVNFHSMLFLLALLKFWEQPWVQKSKRKGEVSFPEPFTQFLVFTSLPLSAIIFPFTVHITPVTVTVISRVVMFVLIHVLRIPLIFTGTGTIFIVSLWTWETQTKPLRKLMQHIGFVVCRLQHKKKQQQLQVEGSAAFILRALFHQAEETRRNVLWNANENFRP